MRRIMLLAGMMAGAAFAVSVPVFDGNLNPNGVGRVKVEAVAEETLLANPFAACLSALQESEGIKPADLVSPDGLEAANEDEQDYAAWLFILDNGEYVTYYNDEDAGWALVNGDASAVLFPGDGFWLTLPENAQKKTVWLAGEVVAQQAVPIAKGNNLIGAAIPRDWTLGELTVENGYSNSRIIRSDYIVVPGATSNAKYYWNGEKFQSQSGEDASDVTVKAGTGIYYYSQGKASGETVVTLKQ